METPVFLTLEQALNFHEVAIDEYGGSHGVRDLGLLESALAQPEQVFGGQYLHSFPFEMAAAYLYHVCRNHPFHDGNKRVELMLADTFLSLNGWNLVDENDRIRDFVLEVASGAKEKVAIARYLKEH